MSSCQTLLANIVWSLCLLAPEQFLGQKLGCSQLEGLEWGSGKGNKNQRKVLLRKNSEHPEVLPRGGEQGSEGRIMAHIWEACVIESRGDSSLVTWLSMVIREESLSPAAVGDGQWTDQEDPDPGLGLTGQSQREKNGRWTDAVWSGL